MDSSPEIDKSGQKKDECTLVVEHGNGRRETIMLQRVTLSARDALGMVGAIILGIAATVGGLHSIAANLREEMMQQSAELRKAMVDLDERWQQRVLQSEERIRTEVGAIRAQVDQGILPIATERISRIYEQLDQLENRIRSIEQDKG